MVSCASQVSLALSAALVFFCVDMGGPVHMKESWRLMGAGCMACVGF